MKTTKTLGRAAVIGLFFFTVIACGDDGSSMNETPEDDAGPTDEADAGQQTDPDCEDGAIRCDDGDTLGECTDGQWTSSACDGDAPACLDGACVACAPGAEECREGVAYGCDEDGSWTSLNACAGENLNCAGCELDEPCADNTDCSSDSCVNDTCAECVVDEQDCSGSTPRVCDEDGSWIEQNGCEGATPECVLGQCVACTEGQDRACGQCGTQACDGGSWASCDNECGAFGTCVDPDGAAECVCDDGAGGDQCDACKPGFVEDAGACLPDCGICGDHSFCDGSLTVPRCGCVVSYDETAGACTWGGALQDTSFAEAGWTTTLTTIDPDDFGADDGSATFDFNGWCGPSSISQTITMPAYADAEPLVLVLRGDGNRDTSSSTCQFSTPDLDVTIDGGLSTVSLGTAASFDTTLCLGERAYGGDVTLSVGPNAGSNAGCTDPNSTQCRTPVLREVFIRPATAGECALPGEVVNGDFASTDGWVLGENVANNYPYTLEIAGGELRLGIVRTCSRVWATTALSLPLDDQVAIRFDVNGTLGRDMLVWLDGQNAGEVTGTGATESVVICPPDYMRGMQVDLEFRLSAIGGCGGLITTDFVIDNVEIVSEAACAGSTAMDGGFEGFLAFGITPWELSSDDDTCGNCEGIIEILDDTSLAYEGDASLHVRFEGVDQFGGVRATVRGRVPTPAGGPRPALRFQYRKDGTGTDTLNVGFANTAITGSSAWSQQEICIDEDFAGQVLDFNFRFRHSNQSTVTDHYIDNVELVLSDGC